MSQKNVSSGVRVRLNVGNKYEKSEVEGSEEVLCPPQLRVWV